MTRDIPPVVYFHEQSPKKLQEEVSEYIITGGFPGTDPRARRVRSGIHEQFVHLLRGILLEMGKRSGPELPASWISGFYGSGKSSFAKLLGLSLNGEILPDGNALSTALLKCDDSPLRNELVDAWKQLSDRGPALAVVFDIGGVARDDEHIHSAVLRLVQARLGYCAKEQPGRRFRTQARTRRRVGSPSWRLQRRPSARSGKSPAAKSRPRITSPTFSTFSPSPSAIRTPASGSMTELAHAPRCKYQRAGSCRRY